MPPVGAKVSALSVISERSIASCHSPPGLQRSDHSRHQRSASSSARSGCGLSGGASCEGCQVSTKRHAVAGAQRELRHRRQVLAARLDRRAQGQRVGAGHGEQRVVEASHPGHYAAVVEADGELHAHRNAAAHPLHHAHHVRRNGARGHEVHQPHRSLVRLELRVEHERPLAVGARAAPDLALRRDQPASVALASQERGEAGRGVEARHAQPVDRAVAADEAGGLRVADERVVLDAQRHDPILTDGAVGSGGAKPPAGPARPGRRLTGTSARGSKMLGADALPASSGPRAAAGEHRARRLTLASDDDSRSTGPPAADRSWRPS